MVVNKAEPNENTFTILEAGDIEPYTLKLYYMFALRSGTPRPSHCLFDVDLVRL